MNTWLLALGSVLLGIVLGLGTTVARYELTDSGALFTTGDNNQPALAPEGGPQPKVQVDQEDYDFGVMEREATRSHSFVFTNVGDYPLELVQGETTCKCTISTLENQAIQPGESVEVTLEWTAQTTGDQFRQSATILTNDRSRPSITLTVSGRITQSIEVEPKDLVFSKVQVGESRTADLRLISYNSDALKLAKHEFTNENAADHFELATEPLPAAELPSGAKSGLLVSVTLKPGLPVGSVSQELKLTPDGSGETAITVPISARIASNISIFGQGWNANRGILGLGTVKSSTGLRHELSVFVRGDHPEQVEFTVASVTPDVLKVTLGEKQVVREGAVVKVPLVIEIPAGSRPASHLGYEPGQMGEILLETNHAEAEALRLLVNFAVEN